MIFVSPSALWRSRLFAIVAVLSLALGIGANIAIFALIDQIVLGKLRVTRPHELLMLPGRPEWTIRARDRCTWPAETWLRHRIGASVDAGALPGDSHS
jgi:hypothetical protein